MRVLALTRYGRLGSSSRVRFYQYFPYLQSHGLEIVNASFFDDGYVNNLYAGQSLSVKPILSAYLKRLLDLIKSSSFDLIWVEKEMLPWFPAPLEFLLHKTNIPYVVDYDDAVFHRYGLHPSSLVRMLLGHKIDRVMRNAALVIVGNEYLAERAKQAGAGKVELLPSVVDVGRYTQKQTHSGSIFTIGWIGSPVTAPYLDIIRDAVTSFGSELSIRIFLLGAGSINPFPNVLTTILPWDEEIELSIGERFDVGIMPLTDGPFERGKCGYKLIQYMAGGLPVIASPVGVNRQIVEHDINGYLAGSNENWIAAFRTLKHDINKRYEMGQAGRRKAEKLYNLEVAAPQLLTLLSNVRKG